MSVMHRKYYASLACGNANERIFMNLFHTFVTGRAFFEPGVCSYVQLRFSYCFGLHYILLMAKPKLASCCFLEESF